MQIRDTSIVKPIGLSYVQIMTDSEFQIIHSMDGTLPANETSSFVHFPFLPALAAEIHGLMDAPGEVRGRQYQRDLIRCGFFTVTSPANGMPIASGDSIILPDRTVFYRFPECHELLIGAANLGKGYPLTAVILLNIRLLIQIGESTWGVQKRHALAVEKILRNPEWYPPRPADQIQLFTGDTSYAHHAWNQLTALESMLQEKSSRFTSIPVFATFQPLGPLNELFPEWLAKPVAREAASIPAICNRPGRVSVNPGGFLLTASVRERVRALAFRHCPEERLRQYRQLLQQHAPVFWISIRTRNRTATNQRLVIIALCRRFLGQYPHGAIILDGHSYPDDLFTNPSYHLSEMQTCMEQDLAEVDVILDRLRADGFPLSGQLIVPAAGLHIYESIVLAHAAQFYFCHHGTVQHKIGWLTRTPGVVHSNRRTLDIRPAQWVANQSEGVPVPIYIPASLVDDEQEKIPEDETVKSRFFEHYRFIDETQVVNFVMECLQRERISNPLLYRMLRAGGRMPFLSVLYRCVMRLFSGGRHAWRRGISKQKRD